MTLLFEGAGPTGPAVELIARVGRGVALLEFAAEGEGRGETMAADAEPAVDVGEIRAAQVQAIVDTAREQGRAEAWAEFGEEMERRLSGERARLEEMGAEMARGFAQDRERYFAAAETQVVRLALAVAKRVLCREVEADAMHLTATVRAALSRVKEDDGTVMKVCEDEVEAWRGVLGDEVEVRGERGVRVGECVLETKVGRVELGVEAQMGEVERGFMELAERR